MKIVIAKCLAIAILISLSGVAQGQGCSDAGFCTINSLKPDNSDTSATAINQLKSGVNFGSAEKSIKVIGNYLEFSRLLSKRFGMDFRITGLFQNGNSISAHGLSDIYINASYKLNKKVNLTTAVKIPLSDGNRMNGTLPLPMDYQSSLGTFDLIAGFRYSVKHIELVIALQQPLTQNKNTFIAELYPENSIIRTFQSANKFKRSGDVLMRISYPVKISEKFKITPGVLPINHLSNDKYTDTLGIERDIKGSQGLTLNGNLYFDYEINRKNALQLYVGVPFVVREARPDGLTRHFVVNLEYKIKF